VISIVTRGPIRETEGRDVVSEIVPGAQLDPTTANLPMQRRDPHGHSHREAHRHGEAHGGRTGELDDHRDGDVGL
jgi:hypothetical protein